MVISQARSKKSSTGSRYVDFRKKKQYECGREPTLTRVGTAKKKVLRTMGGDQKLTLVPLKHRRQWNLGPVILIMVLCSVAVVAAIVLPCSR